jgi:hypothetical protein
MSSCRIMGYVVGVCVALCGQVVYGQGEASPDVVEPNVISLGAVINAAAYNPETGAVAGIDVFTDSVWLFKPAFFGGKTYEKVGPVKVSKNPSAIVYKKYGKKSVYVVFCRGETFAYVLDTKTLRLLRKIDLEVSDVSQACASSNPDDPIVYFTSRGRPSAFGAINLETGASTSKIIFLSSTFRLSLTDVNVSSDGMFLYVCRSGSPRGVSSQKKVDIVDGFPRFKQVAYYHSSMGQYSPGARSALCVVGSNSVYSADLKRELGKLGSRSGHVVAMFGDVPLIVSSSLVSKYNLRNRQRSPKKPWEMDLFSANTLKELSTLQLSSKNLSYTVPNKVEGMSRTLLGQLKRDLKPIFIADDKNKRIIVLYGDKGMAVSLSQFPSYTSQPWLIVKPSNDTFPQGKPGTVKLELETKGVTFKLLEGPKGMTIAGNTIRYTPSAETIGPIAVKVEVTAEVSRKLIRRNEEFSFTVTRPSLTLPFVPTGMAISPDGTRALLWRSPSRRHGSRATPEPSRLMVVDTLKKKVLVEKPYIHGIYMGSIDSHGVYISPVGKSKVDVLSLDDLSNQKELFGEGNGRIFVKSVSDGVLAMFSPSNQKKSLLQMVDSKARKIMWEESGLMTYPQLTNAYGLKNWYWTCGALVFTGEGKRIGWKQSGGPAEAAPLSSMQWGYSVSGGSLINPARGNRVNVGVASGLFPVKAFPCFVATRGSKTNTSVVFYSPASRKVVGTIAVYPRVSGRNTPRRFGPAPQSVQTVGDMVYVFNENSFYWIPIPATVKAQCSQLPLCIYPELSMFPVLTQGDSMTVQCKSTKKMDTYGLVGNSPGVTVDAKTGVVTMDAQKLRKALRPLNRYDAARLRKLYKAIYNKETSSVPLIVPVSLIAQDSDGMKVGNEFSFTVLVEEKDFPAASAKGEAGPSPTDLEARVKKLEKEVEILKRRVGLR